MEGAGGSGVPSSICCQGHAGRTLWRYIWELDERKVLRRVIRDVVIAREGDIETKTAWGGADVRPSAGGGEET